MVSRIPILQTCNVVVVLKQRLGFVPTSAQFFAVSTFLILRSPSWTRSCIQKYRVSMCFVRCPAPNRSVKEFAIELSSLCITIFIGIPRSWYIDLRDSQLDLLSPLRKMSLLQRSMLSSSEALIQISPCGYQSEPPIPSCSSSRLGRQQSRCPRRL